MTPAAPAAPATHAAESTAVAAAPPTAADRLTSSSGASSSSVTPPVLGGAHSDERGPAASCPGHPVGPHDGLAIDEVMALLPGVSGWARVDRGASPGRRLRGARRLLEGLAVWPGTGWQQRWQAAGVDHRRAWFAELSVDDDRQAVTNRTELAAGMNWLILGRVLRPGLEFFRHHQAYVLLSATPDLISPDTFARVAEFAAQSTVRAGERDRARAVLVRLVLHTGKELSELAPADFDEYKAWSRCTGHDIKGLHAGWELLAGIGVFPAGSTLRAHNRRGQQSIPEIVDFYGVTDPEVRVVLIRYLTERSPGMDYNSLRGLAAHLVGRFWVDIERHHPQITGLHLPEDVALAWKERLMLVGDGAPGARRRKTWFDTVLRVRAFYLDIREWALTDPSWAQWSVPSPVRRRDTEGFVKARKQVTAQMHQRIRERLPQLPALVDSATAHRLEQQQMLAAATDTDVAAVFFHAGRRYRKIADDPVLVEDSGTGERLDLTRTEDEAFWTWSVIETLRHTGVRIEELLELTHLALTSYRLPSTGEVVPLLQIPRSAVDGHMSGVESV